MKKIIFLTILMSMFNSSLSYSARVSTGWFKVQEAGSDSNGPFVVFPPQGVADNCSAGFNWGIGAAELTEDGYKTSISVMLAAFMAGKEIRLDYEDSTPGCYVYRVRVK